MARKFKGNSLKRGNIVEMYGMKELLNKIEDAGGKVDEAVAKAVDSSLELVGKDMQTFMEKHKLTGETYASYEQIPAKTNGETITANVGYNVNKGGLPAVFLDIYDGGTPKSRPHFFRYYAVENNREQINKIQRDTLNEILEGLK